MDDYDTSGIEYVGAYGEPDLELVAAQNPDLIVGTEFDEGIYEELSQIAPTVLIQIFGTRPLTEVLADFAELAGAEEQHEKLKAEYEQAVDDLIADLPRPPEEISLSYVSFTADGQFYVDVGQAVGTVLDDVGFARPGPEEEAEQGGERVYFSFETITEHGQADIMITGDFSADENATESPEIAAARDQELFQGLDVVQRGEFHVFDGNEMVGSSFGKMQNFLDFLRSILVEREPNLTGDPA